VASLPTFASGVIQSVVFESNDVFYVSEAYNVRRLLSKRLFPEPVSILCAGGQPCSEEATVGVPVTLRVLDYSPGDRLLVSESPLVFLRDDWKDSNLFQDSPSCPACALYPLSSDSVVHTPTTPATFHVYRYFRAFAEWSDNVGAQEVRIFF
jgi:hypothetical protein